MQLRRGGPANRPGGRVRPSQMAAHDTNSGSGPIREMPMPSEAKALLGLCLVVAVATAIGLAVYLLITLSR